MSDDSFSRSHPTVSAAFFLSAALFPVIFTHPAFLLISLFSSFIYSVALRGIKALLFSLKFSLPLLVLTMLFNPLFNHSGVTVLAYFPNGNPLTAESLIYGLAAGAMLSGSLNWFSCFNEIMTTDKYICLFRRLPSLALLISMTLRFVPRLSEQIKKTRQALSPFVDAANKNPFYRIRCSLKIFSSVLSWVFENGIDTADSMKGRGWGLPGRSSYTIFRFEKRDVFILTAIVINSVFITVVSRFEALEWNYFPALSGAHSDGTIAAASVYLINCMLPEIINTAEKLRGKRTEKKKCYAMR